MIAKASYASTTHLLPSPLSLHRIKIRPERRRPQQWYLERSAEIVGYQLQKDRLRSQPSHFFTGVIARVSQNAQISVLEGMSSVVRVGSEVRIEEREAHAMELNNLTSVHHQPAGADSITLTAGNFGTTTATVAKKFTTNSTTSYRV